MKVRTYLALMGAAILVPVLAFSAIALQMLLDVEREAFVRSMSESARATTLAVDKRWSYAEGVVRTLATSDGLANGDLASFYQQAKTATEGERTRIALLDEQGRQFFNTVVPFGTRIAPKPESEARIRTVLKGKNAQISNLIVGSATGKHVASIELPVQLKTGKRLVVSGWFYVDEFTGALPTEGIPSSWLIGVFDRDGRTVIRNRGPKEYEGSFPKDDLLQAIKSTQVHYIRNQSRDGINLHTVLIRSQLSGWTVAVGVPVDVIEANARKTVALTAAGLVVAIVLALGAAVFFGRKLVHAIDGATRAAVLLGTGGVPPMMNSGVDELNQLHIALVEAGTILYHNELEREQLLGEARSAREDAESQNKSKDEFLAMLGHELRNPLSAITAGMALIEMEDAPTDRSRRTREIMRRQCSLLTNIVDDLLDASRVMSGKVTLLKQRVDLKFAVQSCLAALQARGVTQTYSVEFEGESTFVDADPVRLDQIIGNLLENAFKYTPEGGHIRLSVGTESGRASFVVRDSGIGMSQELLPRIFDIFVQGPASIDRSAGGMGIGLSVVQSMVKQHGGAIDAASEGEGQGSLFRIVLPLAESREDDLATAVPIVESKPKRVLVVDDNDDAREILGELLALHSCQIIEASTGEEAVRIAINDLPDIAIIDIGLPDISGYEVATRLRQDAHAKGVKLIALTGYGQESDRLKALEAGFDMHLKKPVDLDELLAAIR